MRPDVLVTPASRSGAPIFGRVFRVHLSSFQRTASPMASTLQYAMDAGGASGPPGHRERHLPWSVVMNERTALIGLLLSGFFAVACIRASVPSPASGTFWTNMLRFPGRIERLRRSRWQWFAMVSFMIVLRLQQQLPLVLELMAAFQFLLFLVLPTRAATNGSERRSNAAAA